MVGDYSFTGGVLIPFMCTQLTLAEFKTNLNKILDLLRSPESPNYSPETQFVLITPPPVDASTRTADLAQRDPPRSPDRDAERTRQFSEAVKEVAHQSNLPVLDAWSLVDSAARNDGGLDKYLNDGLHLTAAGYGVVTAGRMTLSPLRRRLRNKLTCSDILAAARTVRAHRVRAATATLVAIGPGFPALDRFHRPRVALLSHPSRPSEIPCGYLIRALASLIFFPQRNILRALSNCVAKEKGALEQSIGGDA